MTSEHNRGGPPRQSSINRYADHASFSTSRPHCQEKLNLIISLAKNVRNSSNKYLEQDQNGGNVNPVTGRLQ